jgi:MCM OB domain
MAATSTVLQCRGRACQNRTSVRSQFFRRCTNADAFLPRVALLAQLKATHILVQCKTCKNTKRIACKPGMGGAMIPRFCDMGGAPGGGAPECGSDPFQILPSRSVYVDQQVLKLQVRAPRPGDHPPACLSACCRRDRQTDLDLQGGFPRRQTELGLTRPLPDVLGF